jgi:hypothetical protein
LADLLFPGHNVEHEIWQRLALKKKDLQKWYSALAKGSGALNSKP